MEKNYRLLNPDEHIIATDEIFWSDAGWHLASKAWADNKVGSLIVRREITTPTPSSTKKQYRLLNVAARIIADDEVFFPADQKLVSAKECWIGHTARLLKVRRKITPPTPDHMEKQYRLLSPHEITISTDEAWHSINEEWVPVEESREGDVAGVHIIRREIPPPELEAPLTVIELALCESDFIIPRPNLLYKYYVGEGCEKCAAIANVYKQPGL
ncbi:MAG: hypothetical protein VXB01_06280 [Opitutae bacterium]